MPAFNLSPAQRADLRAQAHALKPVVIIGADGLTEPVLAEAERALRFHQLIKIRVFGDDRDARVAMADTLRDRLDAALVQHIGKLLVLWRPSDEAADIVAPAPRGRGGPSANAATARRVADAAGASRTKAVKTGRSAARAGATIAPGRTAARKLASATASASPRERASARAADATAQTSSTRAGKGAPPRLVTVVKPTGNDRRRARPTAVLVRGNERVTAGGNVKRAKKRPTSVKRLRQQD